MEQMKKIIADVSTNMGHPMKPEEVIQLPLDKKSDEAVLQVEFKISDMPATQMGYIMEALKKIDVGEQACIRDIELFPFINGRWCMGLTVDTDCNLTSLQIPSQLKKLLNTPDVKVDEFQRYFTYIITFEIPTFSLRINMEHLEDIDKVEVRKYLRYKVFSGLKEFFKTPLIPMEYSVY